MQNSSWALSDVDIITAADKGSQTICNILPHRRRRQRRPQLHEHVQARLGVRLQHPPGERVHTHGQLLRRREDSPGMDAAVTCHGQRVASPKCKQC